MNIDLFDVVDKKMGCRYGT